MNFDVDILRKTAIRNLWIILYSINTKKCNCELTVDCLNKNFNILKS